MKKLTIIFLFLVACINSFAQCPAVNTNNATVTCAAPCATITATPTYTLNATTSYLVSTIPFAGASYTTGTSVVMGDDYYSSVITLPFCFNFFGNSYTQCLIGSNGNICFDITLAGAFDPWSISGPLPGSNCNATKNAIMAPWCDMYQSPGGVTPGTIKYFTTGSYPCRTFVVSWCTPMFSCTTTRDTTQVVLHETTNVIDIFIKRHNGSCSWNSGRAVTGLENSTGTSFITAPGENGTSFNAINEAWRFQPSGTVIPWLYTWTGPSGVVGTTPTINICPTVTTTYTAAITAAAPCGSVTFTNTSLVTYGSGPIYDTTLYASICQGNSVIFAGSSYNATGVYTHLYTSISGCDSTVHLNLTVNPTYNLSIDTFICGNEYYSFGGTTYNTSGIYTHTFNTIKGCDSTVTLNLHVYPIPTATYEANKYICVGDTFRLALLSHSSQITDYLWNFAGANVIVGSSDHGGPYLLSYNTVGTHVISLLVQDSLCFSNPILDTVYVGGYHPAKISPFNDNTCFGDSILFRPDTIVVGDYYNWTPVQYFIPFQSHITETYAYAKMYQSGIVYLTVTTPYGCVSVDSIYVNGHSCCDLFIPDAFTPNNDGLNDKFGPSHGSYKLHQFLIVNRWGQVVFETISGENKWDGKFCGIEQDLGVYFYSISYECDGKEHFRKGTVTLIK